MENQSQMCLAGVMSSDGCSQCLAGTFWTGVGAWLYLSSCDRKSWISYCYCELNVLTWSIIQNTKPVSGHWRALDWMQWAGATACNTCDPGSYSTSSGSKLSAWLHKINFRIIRGRPSFWPRVWPWACLQGQLHLQHANGARMARLRLVQVRQSTSKADQETYSPSYCNRYFWYSKLFLKCIFSCRVSDFFSLYFVLTWNLCWCSRCELSCFQGFPWT